MSMPLYSWKYSRVQNVVTFRFVQNIHVYLAGTHKLSLMVAPIFAPVKLSSYKCMVSSCLFEVYMYTCTVCVCLRSKVAQKYLHIRVSCLFPILLLHSPTTILCTYCMYVCTTVVLYCSDQDWWQSWEGCPDIWKVKREFPSHKPSSLCVLTHTHATLFLQIQYLRMFECV